MTEVKKLGGHAKTLGELYPLSNRVRGVISRNQVRKHIGNNPAAASKWKRSVNTGAGIRKMFTPRRRGARQGHVLNLINRRRERGGGVQR